MVSILREWFDLARIGIKNQGEDNDVNIKILEGKHCNITKPQWFSKNGKGSVIESSDKHILLEIECLGKGKLVVRLQGVARQISGGHILPLWVDYTRLAINRNVIFGELKPLWYDKHYYFSKDVTDGEKVEVEVSWSCHAYRGEEIANLLSMLCVGNIAMKKGAV